jgi:TrmH family RNA methyltransferase
VRRFPALPPHYNHFLPAETQSAQTQSAQTHSLEVVLVSPRNPLNIGAVARAMANFGFAYLSVVAPYEPHWREARSAIGAPGLLQNAKESATLAEAVANCTLVIGTATLTHRKPEQRVVPLPALPPLVQQEFNRAGRVALVFGPEKHGLTREDLSWCNLLVEIPTDPRQPSMNLGQAVAVCLYELTSRAHQTSVVESARNVRLSTTDSPLDDEENGPTGKGPSSTVKGTGFSPYIGATQSDRALAPEGILCSDDRPSHPPAAPASSLDLLASVIEETMVAARYSPRSMQAANRHDLRLLLRRLSPTQRDARRILGLFRRILWRLRQVPRGN